MTARRPRFATLAAATLVTACAGPDPGPTTEYDVPAATHFDAVTRTLDAHCGTLDCHGSTSRNLRLFGWSGRRLDAKDLPGGVPTTPREAGLDYCAVIGLEPELLERVSRGELAPERLTLIRKIREAEPHEGGDVFPAGSAGDECLVAWLTGDVARLLAACERSLDDLNDAPPPSAGVDLAACNAPVESLK